MIATIIFWICATIIGYVYVGYPVLLAAGFLGRKTSVLRGSRLPTVSIIIPAHNEAANIEKKLRNTADLLYPAHLREVLVGSDGSTDGTAELVRKHGSVQLFESACQIGKSSIQNELVRRSTGDVLVFTDCDCFLDPDAVNRLLSDFTDDSVGLVTARPWYVNAGENKVTENEGLYLRYESWIRNEESARGVLAVASGSLFALRRSLWAPIPPNQGDDFFLPLHVALSGRRSILETSAIVRTELSQSRLRLLVAMKRRIISKDLLALVSRLSVLNPFRTGRVAIGLLSHKLLRWLAPYFFLGLFISNIFLEGSYARAFLLLQAAFYAMAILGSRVRSRRIPSIWLIPTSFCAVNYAAALAIVQTLSGTTIGKWQPDRQKSEPDQSAARA